MTMMTTENKQMRQSIRRPSEGVIVVGTPVKGRLPMFLKHTCVGCSRELIVMSTLPKDKAAKFNKCGACFEKARSAAFRAKLEQQFDQLPNELKLAWHQASEDAAVLAAERQ